MLIGGLIRGRSSEATMDEPEVHPEDVPVERIRDSQDVKDELQKAARPPEPTRIASPRSEWSLVALHVALAMGFGAAALVVRTKPFPISELVTHRIAQILIAAALSLSVLAIHRAGGILIRAHVRNKASRYNLMRVLRLMTILLIAGSIVSVFFADWYSTAVSLGLISLILGLALQAPITSFFAWIYILVRSPYRVGDRIRIGQATGDVIDVAYLDTTLWEFGGEFLSTDHPSGRIIRFPNSTVFNSTVFNYSWPLFPYIWNEITVQVAYESDLEFVASVMMATVEEEMGPAMEERVRVYREILADTPVDHLEVADRPAVLFRVNPNTWIDATVRYLVTPRRAGTRKTLLTRRILDRLNAEPGKVLFPKANMR